MQTEETGIETTQTNAPQEEQAPARPRRPRKAAIPEGFQGMDISDDVLRAIGRMGFQEPNGQDPGLRHPDA